MNIFVLDRDPHKAAVLQCDRHVVKMCLESAQMLSTARILLNLDAPYKPTHKNHPCTKWVAQDPIHYMWLWEHFEALCTEYTKRYNKTHACSRFLNLFDIRHTTNYYKYVKEKFLKLDHILAMPDKYKTSCPVQSYRAYYKGEKAYMAKWKYGNEPNWWRSYE